jgi:hypothetical protein
VYEIKPEPGRDDCEGHVLLAADDAGLSYVRDAEPEIRRQPRGGGREATLARASGPIFALAVEGKTLRWLTAAGTPGSASLR